MEQAADEWAARRMTSTDLVAVWWFLWTRGGRESFTARALSPATDPARNPERERHRVINDDGSGVEGTASSHSTS